MSTEATRSGIPARRIHLVVAIDRFLARLDRAAPRDSWIVKGGYANQLRLPDEARFTEDLDLRIDASIDQAPTLMAAGFSADLGDDFAYEAQARPTDLLGPPGGGLRYVVVVRLAGTPLVTFKADISGADAIVGHLEMYVSDPVVARLGLPSSRFPVYPVAQHVAEPREVDEIAWFGDHFTFGSSDLIEACRVTFSHRATHPWPRRCRSHRDPGASHTSGGVTSSDSRLERSRNALRQ